MATLFRYLTKNLHFYLLLTVLGVGCGRVEIHGIDEIISFCSFCRPKDSTETHQEIKIPPSKDGGVDFFD